MYKRSFITIGNEKLPIISSCDSKHRPILLVCGGGPGIPQYFLEYLYPSVLDEYFDVVYFDYRGTGLFSRERLRNIDMTTERYLTDIKKLAEYFISVEPESKLYILGHSFGTYIALQAVKRFPDYFNSYIAVSQICNQYVSECMAVEYMKSWYAIHNNKKKANRFDRFNIWKDEACYHNYVVSPLRDASMHEIGIGTTRNMRSPVKEIFLPSLKCPMYSFGELVKIWKRKFAASCYPVTSDAMRFNAFEEVSEIEIPIFFITGRHDYTCNVELQISYFERIKSPYKKLFLFEEAAHSPIYECPDESRKVLNTILEKTHSELY